MIHIRNGRAGSHDRTSGSGATWCGKKLLGAPVRSDGDIEVFVSYGSELRVTMAPAEGTCTGCKAAFDIAYNAAFPNGMQPIATFRLDNLDDMAKARGLLGRAILK